MAEHSKQAGPRAGQGSVAADFGLILEAFADAFRGLSSTLRLESRASKSRALGGKC